MLNKTSYRIFFFGYIISIKTELTSDNDSELISKINFHGKTPLSVRRALNRNFLYHPVEEWLNGDKWSSFVDFLFEKGEYGIPVFGIPLKVDDHIFIPVLKHNKDNAPSIYDVAYIPNAWCKNMPNGVRFNTDLSDLSDFYILLKEHLKGCIYSKNIDSYKINLSQKLHSMKTTRKVSINLISHLSEEFKYSIFVNSDDPYLKYQTLDSSKIQLSLFLPYVSHNNGVKSLDRIFYLDEETPLSKFIIDKTLNHFTTNDYSTIEFYTFIYKALKSYSENNFIKRTSSFFGVLNSPSIVDPISFYKDNLKKIIVELIPFSDIHQCGNYKFTFVYSENDTRDVYGFTSIVLNYNVPLETVEFYYNNLNFKFSLFYDSTVNSFKVFNVIPINNKNYNHNHNLAYVNRCNSIYLDFKSCDLSFIYESSFPRTRTSLNIETSEVNRNLFIKDCSSKVISDNIEVFYNIKTSILTSKFKYKIPNSKFYFNDLPFVFNGSFIGIAFNASGILYTPVLKYYYDIDDYIIIDFIISSLSPFSSKLLFTLSDNFLNISYSKWYNFDFSEFTNI